MEIKKGDKVRVISKEHTTPIHGPHQFPIGIEVSVEDKDCGSCWCYSGSQSWWVHADDLELIENQEYIKMRGLDAANYLYVEGTPPNPDSTITTSASFEVPDGGTSVGGYNPFAQDVIRESNIRTFETGAVRDSNKGKSRPDLISPYFTERLGYRLAYGIEKGYGANNWKKGIPDEAFLESLERHLIAYKMGKTDEDHAGAIAFNIMGIIHNEEVRKLGRDPLTQYMEDQKV